MLLEQTSISISEIAFMGFGLFMMILLSLIVFFGLRYMKQNVEQFGRKLKKCPFCAETIQKEAISLSDIVKENLLKIMSIKKVTQHPSQNEELIFDRSQTGRVGYMFAETGCRRNESRRDYSGGTAPRRRSRRRAGSFRS